MPSKDGISWVEDLPSEEEIQQGLRFKTYVNYLESISNFLGDVYHNPTDMIGPVIQSKTFKALQGGRCDDSSRLAQHLRNSWFTEIQMSISAQFDEFVEYSNHWLPVQTYYAVYLALRAFFQASGQNVGGEHGSNLKAIGEEIQRRPNLFPFPWKVVCVGNPENKLWKLSNLPPEVEISDVSCLSSYHRVEFWDSYAKFLKTTRLRQLKKQCDDWKHTEGKKKVPKTEKARFVENMTPTSIFNCLYRLRLRSNYADADSFLLSVYGSAQGASFHVSLRKICWSTLFVIEVLIARYLGKKEFGSIVESFRRYDKGDLSDHLIGFRWETIRNLW